MKFTHPRIAALSLPLRKLVFAALSIALCAAVGAAWGQERTAAADAPRPEWIWCESRGQPLSQADLVKTIPVDKTLRAARIVGGADFCHLTIIVNGEAAAVVDAYADWFDLDLTRFFTQGDNRIQLRARAVEGPAAVALAVQLEFGDGTRSRQLTGESWTVDSDDSRESAGAAAGVVSYGAVLRQMWTPLRPAQIEPADDYTQWKRALRDRADENGADATFDLADGYRIEHLLRAGEHQSSWVSMGVHGSKSGASGKAGVLIGREDQGLLRIRFPSGRAVIQDVPCDQELKEVRGIAPHADGDAKTISWTVNANNSKATFALSDDGERLAAVKLFDLPGGVGHGRNDLLWTMGARGSWSPRGARLQLGREELVYAIQGDAVDMPRGERVEYLTSPQRDARRGRSTREGRLLQLRPAASQPTPEQTPEQTSQQKTAEPWELTVVAAGLRNPYGVAMNADGEKFTYDADAEFDMGAPWYRPTRIVHLVSGADYGWRGVTKQWPPYFPDHADNALPLCTVGKGSPTSVAFGYAGDFPETDRRALYVLDWAYGRVLRVHLTPRGSGYRARCETFLRGRPLNVTDLGFLDGSMLLITGGRRTQSDLYRIRFVGEKPPAAVSRQQQRREAFGRTQRLTRRRIEQLHRPLEGTRPERRQRLQEEVVAYLADADPAIRYAARIALEHQPVDDWAGLAWQASNPVAAITMLTALAAAPDAPHDKILSALNAIDWKPLSFSEQARLLRCDALCLQGQVGRESRRTSQRRHLQMFRRAASLQHLQPVGLGKSVDQEAMLLLLSQGVAEATPLAVEQLRAAASQHDELLYLFALRTTTAGWTAPLRQRYFAAFANTRDYLGGDGMPGFIRQIHQQAAAAVPDDERAALGELIELRADEPLPAPRPRPLIRQWTMPELAEKLSGLPPGDARRARRSIKMRSAPRCHRFGSSGRPVGPELTNVGSRFRRQDLLRSMIRPSDVVAEKYRQYAVVTEDGRQLTGIGTWGGDYRSPTLRLATDPLRPDQAVEVPKVEITQRRLSKISPMPTGLLDGFRPEEIADLLAFLMQP